MRNELLIITVICSMACGAASQPAQLGTDTTSVASEGHAGSPPRGSAAEVPEGDDSQDPSLEGEGPAEDSTSDAEPASQTPSTTQPVEGGDEASAQDAPGGEDVAAAPSNGADPGTDTQALVAPLTALIPNTAYPSGPSFGEHPVDVEGAEHLLAFANALRAPDVDPAVMIYGASHTSTGVYAGVIRQLLQQRHGDGGFGFISPFFPHGGYPRFEIQITRAGEWDVASARGRPAEATRFGFAGSYGIGRDGDSFTIYGDALRGSRARVVYTSEPGGADLRIGRVSISTDGPVGLHMAVVPFRGPTIAVRVEGDGRARVHGVVFDREDGAHVDVLGVPGARARKLLRFHRGTLLEGIAARAPNLLVLAYGTNEASGSRVAVERYKRQLRETIEMMRSAAPSASCLLMGPTDFPLRNERRRPAGPRPAVEVVNAAQREIALSAGCAYLDLVAWQGGLGSMPERVDEGIGHRDHIHFTVLGYEQMGHAIVAALTRAGVLPAPAEVDTMTERVIAPPEE